MCSSHDAEEVVLRVSSLCSLQDNSMTLGLVDTIDTVMGHISSNLQSREPHVTLTGSSSTAGSHYQVGRQWGVVGERVLDAQVIGLYTAAEMEHHFLSSSTLCKNPSLEGSPVRIRLEVLGRGMHT